MTFTGRTKTTATTATQRALLCLHEGGWSGVSAGEVGAGVWPERDCRPGRGVSINGGGDYAAQMLLGRLKRAGLVEYAASEGSSRWRLSTKGRNEVRKLTNAKAPKAPRAKPRTGGAIVASSDPCTCGCAPEEHGRDPAYPGSTSCTACGDCIAYEADPEAA
jgi:hypothetical protein